jgi:hypothetical protein
LTEPAYGNCKMVAVNGLAACRKPLMGTPFCRRCRVDCHPIDYLARNVDNTAMQPSAGTSTGSGGTN